MIVFDVAVPSIIEIGLILIPVLIGLGLIAGAIVLIIVLKKRKKK